MTDKEQYLKNVRTWGGHRGKQELIRHLEGEVLSRAESQLAFCYGCSAGYSDGGQSCEMPSCPMFNFMPFNKEKPKSSRSKKTLSPEHLAKLQAGRKKKTE